MRHIPRADRKPIWRSMSAALLLVAAHVTVGAETLDLHEVYQT